MNACCEYTAESPGRRKARATSSSTSFEPLPSTKLFGPHSEARESDCLQLVAAAIGVVVQDVERAADRRERAAGEEPSGFSFDAILRMSASGIPSSRAVSAIGLPGTYGAIPRIDSGASPAGLSRFVRSRVLVQRTAIG